jgi:cell division protein FtsB
MGLRLLTVTLAGLLVLVQVNLWFGKTSLPYVMSLQAQLQEQRLANDAARARNTRLLAEVSDLKEGLEMVEEKARSELGMLRPNEILVQMNRR